MGIKGFEFGLSWGEDSVYFLGGSAGSGFEFGVWV